MRDRRSLSRSGRVELPRETCTFGIETFAGAMCRTSVAGRNAEDCTSFDARIRL